MGSWGPWLWPLGLDLAQNHHLETPMGRRARSNRPHTYLPYSSQYSPFRGRRAEQELLVAAWAPGPRQALCCVLDVVVSLNPCQALRGEGILLMLQVRKLRLGGMHDLLGVRQLVKGS